MTLTNELRTRIKAAIADCDRYIAIEGPRKESLRPEWATKALAHARTHKAKLETALVSGEWTA